MQSSAIVMICRLSICRVTQVYCDKTTQLTSHGFHWKVAKCPSFYYRKFDGKVRWGTPLLGAQAKMGYGFQLPSRSYISETV